MIAAKHLRFDGFVMELTDLTTPPLIRLRGKTIVSRQKGDPHSGRLFHQSSAWAFHMSVADKLTNPRGPFPFDKVSYWRV